MGSGLYYSLKLEIVGQLHQVGSASYFSCPQHNIYIADKKPHLSASCYIKDLICRIMQL